MLNAGIQDIIGEALKTNAQRGVPTKKHAYSGASGLVVLSSLLAGRAFGTQQDMRIICGSSRGPSSVSTQANAYQNKFSLPRFS